MKQVQSVSCNNCNPEMRYFRIGTLKFMFKIACIMGIVIYFFYTLQHSMSFLFGTAILCFDTPYFANEKQFCTGRGSDYTWEVNFTSYLLVINFITSVVRFGMKIIYSDILYITLKRYYPVVIVLTVEEALKLHNRFGT
jgi:hypothetical protein